MQPYQSMKDELKKLRKTYRDGGVKTGTDTQYLIRSYNPQSDRNSWVIPRICFTIITSGIASLILFYTAQTLLWSALIGPLLLFVGLLAIKEVQMKLVNSSKKQDPWNQNLFGEITKQSKYYLVKGNDTVLFIEHDRKLTATGFFELTGIPHNINGTFERFIKGLHHARIPLIWRYLQVPLHLTSRTGELEDLWIVRIVLGTRATRSAWFNLKAKRDDLKQDLQSNLRKIYDAFHKMYPHTALEPLQGKELLRTYTVLLSEGAN